MIPASAVPYYVAQPNTLPYPAGAHHPHHHQQKIGYLGEPYAYDLVWKASAFPEMQVPLMLNYASTQTAGVECGLNPVPAAVVAAVHYEPPTGCDIGPLKPAMPTDVLACAWWPTEVAYQKTRWLPDGYPVELKEFPNSFAQAGNLSGWRGACL